MLTFYSARRWDCQLNALTLGVLEHVRYAMTSYKVVTGGKYTFIGQAAKVRFAFLTFVTWPKPGDESQICFSDFRHLAQAR